jgi:hypothetical protein
MNALVKFFEAIIHEGACCDYDTCCHRRDYHVWHVADVAMFQGQSGNQFRGICEDCGSAEMRSGALWQQLKQHEQDSGSQTMLIREYDMDDVEDEAWTSNPRTRKLVATLQQAEAKCAELAAALAYIDEKCQLYGSSDAARGRIRIVLNDPSALLLAYRAQVERETLERVKDIACGHACVKYHGLCECGPAIAGEIEAEFAPKEDPARGFDESQLRRGKINDKRD